LAVRLRYTVAMSLARLSLGLFGVVGVIAAALAGATIWLLLTDPVTVADAVAEGEVSPFVRELAGVIYDAFQGLLKYL
jgi:multidrug resistance efflux pump